MVSATVAQSVCGWLLLFVRRRPIKGYPACLRTVCFIYLPSFQTQLFCWARLFNANQGHFLHLNFSRVTSIAVESGQIEVYLKLEVKSELVLTHYHNCNKDSRLLCKQHRMFRPQSYKNTKTFSPIGVNFFLHVVIKKLDRKHRTKVYSRVIIK